MRTTRLFHAIFTISSAALAWSTSSTNRNPTDLIPADVLSRRQDGSESTLTAHTVTIPSSVITTSDTSTLTSSEASMTTTSQLISDSASSTVTTTHVTTVSSLSSVDSSDPTGGISMLTPAATLGSQFYRVGDSVTLVWNYTSLLRTPTAIDVLATFTPAAGGIAASPFTLALNASFEPTQTFTWDTGAYASETPLPVGTYTLIVFDADAEGGATATARPGYLGTQEQFYFGVYTPQPYTPLLNAYVCATCNAAGGKMERLTWSVLGGSLVISAASFCWFAGVWRII